MRRRVRAAFAAPLVAAAAAAIAVAASPGTGVASDAQGPPPTPESAFGFAPCTDYKLANYTQIKSYFERLDDASDNMQLVNVGKTSEGRDQIMAIVSAPENLTPANLDKYRGIAERLAHARGLTDEQARQLSQQGKAVAWVDFGIHASEVGPPQTAPQFAYDLVTSKTPEAKSILKNVITLFVPNVDPDGGEHVPDWYMKYVGTQFQDSSYPELYHKYAGHDDNRDWFMFNLNETKNLGNQLWHQWYPELVYDTHQTAAYPARIFLPPFKDPSNPNIPAEVTRGINLLGDSMTQRLDREGKVGAVSRQQYDQWWNGGLRSAPAFHNQVGILSETSHASATPVFEDPTKFPKTFPYQGVSTSEPSAFYPSPYKGGWWHLSDSCGYIESSAWGFLHAADVDRENWLYGQYRMGKQAIAAGGDNAYIIPSDQSDFATATKMVNVLRQADVEVEQAQAAFKVGDKTYPSGSFIVREAQPFRADVVDLMNPQKYPDRRNPDGSPEAPYDMAGWTLPYQMGVKVDKVDESFLVNSKPVDTAPVPAFEVPSAQPGYAYALDPRVNDSYTAAMQLLKAGETVTRTTKPVETSEGTWPEGTFLVGVRPGADTRVKAQAKQLGLTVASVASRPADAVTLTQPRIALYHGWGGNSDEGWTRYVLEQFKLPYTQLHDADVRAGSLRDSYDVIVLPDASYNSMLRGLAPGSHPAKYTGGMTQAGVDNLKAFVQAGGTLVAVNDAAQLPIRAFSGFPITDVTAGVPSTSYYSPGSILAGVVDPKTPLTWGLPEDLDLYSDGSPAFTVNAGAQGVTTPVTYPSANVLRSGWLLGESLIAGKTAVANVKYGDGQVALLGISVQHRAQAHGTYKLLFNALYSSTEK
jgi:Zinc carboxypeptidase